MQQPSRQTIDEFFMSQALEEARLAAQLGEVPVGAVLVRNNRTLATGHNLRETDQHALAHAEIMAIDGGCRALGGWRLQDCDLYVTLEPCPMCTGAIINARVRRVIYGAKDPKAGCMGSLCDLTAMPFNHRPQLTRGVLEEECTQLLQDFFQQLREKKQQEKSEQKPENIV